MSALRLCCFGILLAVLQARPTPAAAEAAKPTAKLDPNRREWSVVPAFTADSDRGYGFGALGMLVRFGQGYDPYRWRSKLLVYMTVKPTPDGGAELAYHDHRFKLDMPGLHGGRLRLNVDLRFARFSTSGYYGFGNAAPARKDPGRFHQYIRTFPQLRAQAQVKVTPRIRLLAGAVFTYNVITPYEGSQLERDLAGDDAETRALLRGTDDHLLAEVTLGWAYDSRDHEFTPSRGAFHDITWRAAPGTSTAGDVYGGLNITSRFYVTLLEDRLIAACRLMLDVLVGHPPFYELAWRGGYEPQEGIGGMYGVRGVPLHRYHGKVKAFANLELRARLWPFKLFGQRFRLGGVVFIDGGRVWTELTGNERLDGRDVGIKFGVGAGPRLQWGETFVIRMDVAWSPDAQPIGFYLEHRHIF
jgi:outer membrane protein assembly factor BamA